MVCIYIGKHNPMSAFWQSIRGPAQCPATCFRGIPLLPCSHNHAAESSPAGQWQTWREQGESSRPGVQLGGGGFSKRSEKSDCGVWELRRQQQQGGAQGLGSAAASEGLCSGKGNNAVRSSWGSCGVHLEQRRLRGDFITPYSSWQEVGGEGKKKKSVSVWLQLALKLSSSRSVLQTVHQKQLYFSKNVRGVYTCICANTCNIN